MLPKMKVLACSLIALSVVIIFHSIKVLSLYASNAPGPGFFPFLLGIALLCLSTVLLFSASSNLDEAPLWPHKSWVRPLQAVILFILFALAFEHIGCIATIFAFSFIWQYLIEHRKVLYNIIVSFATSTFVYVLFVVFLKVPFPMGIFSR